LTLQRCHDCGVVQYPCAEVCQRCLSADLHWSRVDGSGVILGTVHVHASLDAFFREHAPWQICSVMLDAGPRVVSHAQDGDLEPGREVCVVDRCIGTKYSVLVARAKW
jgi:uncharacterized OB-fold protein